LNDITSMTASGLVEAYRTRKLSPVEVLEASLARAAVVQEKLNPFSLIRPDGARAAAREAEARWMKGEAKGPLDGVPLAIKENHGAKDLPKQAGSRTRDPVMDAEDQPHIARLREAGMLIFARTTMPDLGWKGVNDSPLTGVTRNPWNPAMTPGGSSGGAAVAVATGVCPITTGGDGGGSIRIPAGFTGLIGLKATFGRIPRAPRVEIGNLTVNSGCLSRSARDIAR
jgi:aspartyl-tRNA(Asn)/glutamyl-tRNA(Gln) amidotransferase subunit A